MAPMQWHDATVSGGTLTARQEPDVSQVMGRQFDQTSFGFEGIVRDGLVDEFGAATPLPVGLDLPCTEDPELFFAESPSDVEQAKAMCRDCRARLACLAGALERREPWGVWGGELLMRGAIVPRKRPRGRPRKSENTEVAA
jgi:WhiB family transcriptional regulator, redox-sensing transcriptional regulator